MVHCHWEYDLRTAIQIAEAVNQCGRCGWIRCPSTTPNRGSGCARRRGCRSAWANTARREGLKDFILNQACDILHPDLRDSGGFLGEPTVADFRARCGLPMANHNTGSQVCTYATAQWAASGSGTTWRSRNGHRRGRLDEPGPGARPAVPSRGRVHRVDNKPGLGIQLNPDIAARMSRLAKRGGDRRTWNHPGRVADDPRLGPVRRWDATREPVARAGYQQPASRETASVAGNSPATKFPEVGAVEVLLRGAPESSG